MSNPSWMRLPILVFLGACGASATDPTPKPSASGSGETDDASWFVLGADALSTPCGEAPVDCSMQLRIRMVSGVHGETNHKGGLVLPDVPDRPHVIELLLPEGEWSIDEEQISLESGGPPGLPTAGLDTAGRGLVRVPTAGDEWKYYADSERGYFEITSLDTSHGQLPRPNAAFSELDAVRPSIKINGDNFMVYDCNAIHAEDEEQLSLLAGFTAYLRTVDCFKDEGEGLPSYALPSGDSLRLHYELYYQLR